MTMLPTVAIALALFLLLSLAAARTAEGEVPTVADFAACNGQAPDAARRGSAMPTLVDYARADSARASGLTTSPVDVRGKTIASADPQIHGMEAEGAKDATYQAAYRSCMRRKGF